MLSGGRAPSSELGNSFWGETWGGGGMLENCNGIEAIRLYDYIPLLMPIRLII